MNPIKLMRILSIALLISISLPASSAVSLATIPGTTTPVKGEDPRVLKLVERLEEIKAMDRSEMSKSERKSLRKEVKSIKKEMKVLGKGVYLSVGAIIIIILLLILIL
jgi:hypothetical protein